MSSTLTALTTTRQMALAFGASVGSGANLTTPPAVEVACVAPLEETYWLDSSMVAVMVTLRPGAEPWFVAVMV